MNLTTKEIAYLQPSFTERTPIGLFSNVNAVPDGTEYDSLVQKEIIRNGSYSPEALEILLHVANPKRCARLIIKNEFFVVEKYTYRNHDKLVLAENANGELDLKRIADLSGISIGLSELFGMSSIKTTDVAVSLPPDEMMVLLALIDLYRKNTLLDYAGKTDPVQAVSEQEILDEIANGFKNGLVRILIKNSAYKAPDPEEVPRLLASLAVKKCLVSGKGYRLETEYAQLAAHFLIPDTVVLFEAFEVTENEKMPMDGGLCVTAGIHDIIAFVFDGDLVGLYSFSAFQMLSAIEKILACPPLMEEEKPATPPADPSSWTCACGSTNTGKFCAGCGQKKP